MKSDEIARFCRNIRKIYEREGISKKEMAKRLHIGGKTLERIELGELPPRLKCRIFLIISHEFGIHPKDLFR